MEGTPEPWTRPVRNDRTRYPFNMRLEHSLLPEEFEGKAPKGPYQVPRFTYRDIGYEDHLATWRPPYWDDLRHLALKYWMGSEFEVALIQRARNPKSVVAISRVVLAYNERIDQTVQLVTGAQWDEKQYLYVSEKKMNYIQLTSYLLTYLNAVFLDDTIDGVSRVYFQNPLSNPPGELLKVSRGDGVKDHYQRKDYWNAFHEEFYSITQRG